MDPLSFVLEILGPLKYVIGALVLLGIGGFLFAVLFGKRAEIEPEPEPKAKPLYNYVAKRSIMTPAEQDFFNALGMAVGREYRIFPQVYLSSILDEKVKGQDWRAARAHINRKSVDFLLCDKETLSTKLAIELDDKSHDREDRIARDGEVERILAAANIPLLRIKNKGSFDVSELAQSVNAAIQ